LFFFSQPKSFKSSFLLDHEDDEGLPEEEPPLLMRLKVKATETLDPIPPVLLRKYIGYARKYVEPRFAQLSSEGKKRRGK
jgi:DNA replicative helicase MCM subunit Mcm2 (Cdc46/Mcm family)